MARTTAILPKSSRNLGCPVDLGGRSIEAWRGTKQRRLTFCPEREGAPLREVHSAVRLWYEGLSIVAGGNRVPITDSDKRVLSKGP